MVKRISRLLKNSITAQYVMLNLVQHLNQINGLQDPELSSG
jgi:hypothetical protein